MYAAYTKYTQICTKCKQINTNWMNKLIYFTHFLLIISGAYKQPVLHIRTDSTEAPQLQRTTYMDRNIHNFINN